jgi:DNA-directed RNA polymerase specialized sigma24 family protein
MSTNVIALLYAVADTSGIPPGVPSEFEIESAPTDLVEAEAIVEDAAQENAAADQSTMLPETQAPGADPDLWLYRKRTVGLLRRYMRLSIEVGRMPSLLGREFFRTRVTSYRASTFEDAVIFVHDVERSLEKLSDFDKKVIAKTVLQEYPQEEAARLIGCGQRHLARCYVEALDRVSEIFLKRRLLLRLPSVKQDVEKSCQGGKTDEFHLSDSEQTENKY